MKTIKYSLLTMMSLSLILCSSCSSSQKFTVHGIPGTMITTPSNQQLAMIDNTGTADIKLRRKEGYYHYLQAQVPGSNLQVPFALDYKNHSRAVERNLAGGIGLLMFTGGLGSTICGTMMAAGGDGGEMVAVAGVLSMLAGGFMAAPAMKRDDAAEDYDYDYLKTQITNNDIIR